MARYRHEWSDHVFQTPEAAATVQLMLPASAFDSHDFDSEMLDTGHPAGDRSHADVAMTTGRRDDAAGSLRADAAREDHADAVTGARTDDALGAQQQDSLASERESEAKATADVATTDIGSDQLKTDSSEAQTAHVHSAGRQEADQSAQQSDLAIAQDTYEMQMSGLETRWAVSESVGREQLAEMLQGADRSQRRLREDAADDRVTGFESMLRSSAAETADKRGDYFSQMHIRAATSRESVTLALPNLEIQKRTYQPRVLAGRPVEFEIRLKNTRSLVIQDIEIVDPQPEHLELIGIRYGVLEWLVPSLRRVRTERNGVFRVRGPLRPGEIVVFRTRYRSIRPQKSAIIQEIE